MTLVLTRRGRRQKDPKYSRRHMYTVPNSSRRAGEATLLARGILLHGRWFPGMFSNVTKSFIPTGVFYHANRALGCLCLMVLKCVYFEVFAVSELYPTQFTHDWVE